MEILLICLLFTLGILLLFLSGILSKNTAGSIFFTVFGVFILMIVWTLVSDVASEKTLVQYINGEVTYDTVAVDKDGKLLEIKIKDH